MKISHFVKNIAVGVAVSIALAISVNSQIKAPVKMMDEKPKTATNLAKGTFEVKITPQAGDAEGGDPGVGRLLLSKTFAGDLVATSKGQMLGSQSEVVPGSGGYVAMELVTGTLNGKKGAFILQHIGTMQGGKFDLNVAVVPDSGSGEFTGISGKMKIIIEGKDHFYEFEYTISKPKTEPMKK